MLPHCVKYTESLSAVRRKLLLWFKNNKRDFPWRNKSSPFQIMIAEMLLQQTWADKVAPVYEKLLDKYPMYQIAEILMKYKERDLLIVGHTALAGTAEGRKVLSERRAGAVGGYLLSKGARRENQMTYKGMGATAPIADNNTEEGMRKNRRVEIKILEN